MISAIVYWLFRIASAVLGVVPERAAIVAGRVLGRATYYFSPGRRMMAKRHMRRVLGRDDGAARSMFDAYGRYWAEVFWFHPRRRDQIRSNITTEGIHQVEAARDRGSGMIYVLPHVGNWEIAGLLAHDLGLELIAVAESLPNERITEWFVKLRGALGIDIFLTGSRLRAQLQEALGRGAAVALLADRDLRGKGISVDFFGEATTLPAGPATLALRCDVPVFPVAAYFRPGRGHHIVVGPEVAKPGADVRGRALTQFTQSIADGLEVLIKREPTQWHLLQPNWPSDGRGEETS